MNATVATVCRLLLGVGLSLFFVGTATAEPGPAYVVGDLLDPLELEDQHGEPANVDGETRWLLFSRDMEGGEVLKASVHDQDAKSLAVLGAVYVADIHQMPALVSRLMAIPRMRERPYRMLLDHDGAETARIPNPAGHATLLGLEGPRIQSIQHFTEADDLREQLGLQEKEPREPKIPDGVTQP